MHLQLKSVPFGTDHGFLKLTHAAASNRVRQLSNLPTTHRTTARGLQQNPHHRDGWRKKQKPATSGQIAVQTSDACFFGVGKKNDCKKTVVCPLFSQH